MFSPQIHFKIRRDLDLPRSHFSIQHFCQILFWSSCSSVVATVLCKPWQAFHKCRCSWRISCLVRRRTIQEESVVRGKTPQRGSITLLPRHSVADHEEGAAHETGSKVLFLASLFNSKVPSSSPLGNLVSLKRFVT